jgi:hypothetical protein
VGKKVLSEEGFAVNSNDLLSRRAALRRVAAVPAVALGLAAAVGGTAEAAKMTQKAAAYQNKPKGNDKCAGCRFFQAPSSCQLVEGKISPNGWCKMFNAKS